MCPVVFLARIGLLYQHGVVLQIGFPVPGLVAPRVVGPTQTEGEIGLAASQHLMERTLEKRLPTKPIVVIAKAFNACFLCQSSLLLPGFRKTQVVEAEVSRELGLYMTFE